MMHVAYPFYVEPCGVHNFLIRSESSAYQPLRLKIYKKNMKKKTDHSRGRVSEGRVKK